MIWSVAIIAAILAIFAYLFIATWISRRRHGDERDADTNHRGVPKKED